MLKTLGDMLAEVALLTGETGHELSTISSWWNGGAWMASASLDTRFMQVSGPKSDPEAAMVEAIRLCIEKVDDPAERPSTGKPKAKWDDDGY